MNIFTSGMRSGKTIAFATTVAPLIKDGESVLVVGKIDGAWNLKEILMNLGVITTIEVAEKGHILKLKV
jgi:hypothetical protein